MNTWYEYAGNIHMHTTYSDGTGSFDDLAQAARQAGLDFIIVTDHNILVKGEEGYRHRVLVLVGEEVNREQSHENHLLCLGIHQEVSALRDDPQALIDAVNAQGGLSFLAHPIERSSRLVPDTYPWTDWSVRGFTGIELWNYMSSFMEFATNPLQGLLLSTKPQYYPQGPLPEVLALWDDLLTEGSVVAIGGSDAHAQVYHLGFIRRRIFPYEFLFRGVNTHILTPEAFNGQLAHDAALVYGALRRGHAWVAYDLVRSTAHFRFWATVGESRVIQGDRVPLSEGLCLHVVLPTRARILLRKDGEVVEDVRGQTLRREVQEAGIYRVEVWKKAWGKERGWIFSNPIYVVSK